MIATATERIDIAELKRRALGRTIDILARFGFPTELLDGKHHGCPICSEGKDCFRLIDEQAGAVFCNKCFSKGNGDFIDAVAKKTGMGKGEAIRAIAEYLGSPSTAEKPATPRPTSKSVKTYRTADEAAAIYSNYPCEGRWEYLSRAGDLLAVVLRLRINGGKSYRPIMLRDDGQWITGNVNPRPLYGQERFEDAEQIDVFEGERAAEAGTQCGLISTTWMGGAPAVKLTDWSTLAKLPGLKQVNLHPDHDDPGYGAMNAAAKVLTDLNPSLLVKIVKTNAIIELGEGADIADLVEKYTGEIETPWRLIHEAIEAAEFFKPVQAEPAIIEGIEAPNLAEISGQTDEANGRRLWLRNKGRFAWCYTWRTFINYSGRHWTRDESMMMAAMAVETYRSLYDELKNIGHNLSTDALRGITSFIKKSGSAHGQAAMLEMVKAMPGVPVTPSEFNRDTELFNCENGTIDLRTGKIRAHCADDKITQLAPVVYDPAATCPNWRSFIELIFKGDAELIRYVKAAAGYSLTGSQAEQSLFFCYGKGSNGKSTFLNTLKDICGDYGLAASKDLLLTNGNEQHPTALTDLFGRRWVNCIEADEGKRLNESTVKVMTGGESIRARGMRENFYEFPPTHKIWLAANHKPTVRGDDDGIWRRIKLIPFTHKFTDEQKDPDFPAKLRPEWSGILNWMLEGLADWRANGLIVPSVVALASTEYRAEQDRLADWIADRCLVSPSMKARGQSLYSDYASWAVQNPMGSKTFYEKLGERFEKRTSNGVWYHGIALCSE